MLEKGAAPLLRPERLRKISATNCRGPTSRPGNKAAAPGPPQLLDKHKVHKVLQTSCGASPKVHNACPGVREPPRKNVSTGERGWATLAVLKREQCDVSYPGRWTGELLDGSSTGLLADDGRGVTTHKGRARCGRF